MLIRYMDKDFDRGEYILKASGDTIRVYKDNRLVIRYIDGGCIVPEHIYPTHHLFWIGNKLRGLPTGRSIDLRPTYK